VTPRPRIDEVLARPEVKNQVVAAKHHFAIAAGIDPVLEPSRHQAAAFPARDAIWRTVDAVRTQPGNTRLPERAVFNYILDRIFADLTAPIASEEQRRNIYLPVYLPPGRPPARRSRPRETLIEEIRARPDMPDYRVKDRAVSLGVWTSDLSDDAAAVQRRIKRLREAAAT
jgi:hypothetical protein